MKSVLKKGAVWMIAFGLLGGFCGISWGEEMPGFRKNYAYTMGTAREVLWKALASGNATAATVAVMDNGNIVYSEGFGAADRRANRLVDRETRFNIGSTSKMFTAVAILLLRDEGKLSLDDPVAKHLPEFIMQDERYKDITLRMLFNHSSGLPGSTFEFEYESQLNPHSLLLEVLREADLKHDPGAMSIYCNDGFTLAEIVVERLSGKSFMDFLKERIFEPLDMNNTGPSIGESPGKVAFFYEIPEGKKYPLETVTVYGAGGLSSTAEDLCRFADTFTSEGKHILSPESLEEILSLQTTPFSASLRGNAMLDAFGWDYAFLPDYKKLDYQVLAKSGGTLFYSTNLQVLPKERMAVAVSLSGRAAAAEITREILDALMCEKGLPVPPERRLRKPPEPREIPENLFSFGGIYLNGEGAFRFVPDRKEGLLKIYRLLPAPPEGQEEQPFRIFLYSEGLFHDLEKGVAYYFLSRNEDVYFVAREIPVYGFDVPVFQKLPKQQHPRVPLSRNMDNVLWLRRNLLPMTQILGDLVLVRSSANSELPGYLHFLNVVRVRTPDFAEIAATAFRDQMALHLSQRNGTLRARLGMFVFSSEDSAKELRPGNNYVVIGEEGENEWFKLSRGAILSFRKPEKGRILVFAGEEGGVPLYDSVVDHHEVFAPEGSYLLLAGAPGEIFQVFVR